MPVTDATTAGQFREVVERGVIREVSKHEANASTVALPIVHVTVPHPRDKELATRCNLGHWVADGA
jgi:hypothetical protein